jgi:hypothetical protein
LLDEVLEDEVLEDEKLRVFDMQAFINFGRVVDICFTPTLAE